MRVSTLVSGVSNRRWPLAAPAILLSCLTAPLALAAEAGTDVGRIVNAVVGVRAHVPEDARTARTLGTLREGSGVVIDSSGLILTIGYLTLESERIEVITHDGREIPADYVGYDFDSGLGLVRAATPLNVDPLRLGTSTGLDEGTPVLVLSAAGGVPPLPARVVSRRDFAGYWEYLLEDAIFTAPPHSHFGGAALIAADGTVVGIGSLFVRDAGAENSDSPGNMFVPIDALKPVLGDLIAFGLPAARPHPWLGVTIAEATGRVFIARVTPDGPSARAGLLPGDLIVGVAGQPAEGMIDFLRKVWSSGSAGVTVSLDVMRRVGDSVVSETVRIESGNRYEWLRKPGGL